MSKYLVTGAAGFIGSHLIEYLSSLSIEVLAVDALIDSTYSSDIKLKRMSYLEKKLGNIEFLRFDLRNEIGNTIDLEKIDVIINLAALPGLNLSWENFKLYNDCNILTTANLCKAIVESKKKPKLIHISTSSVYGKYAIAKEDTLALQPFSPYGVTKLAAENLIIAYSNNFEMNFNILRLFSVYGPRQRDDMAIQKFCRSFLLGLPITVFGDGNQIRTPTYVEDCVKGIYLSSKSKNDNQIYNLSGKEAITTRDIIDLLKMHFEKEVDIKFAPNRNGDQIETRGDTSKIWNDLNFSASTNFTTGLKNQLDWNLSKEFEITNSI